MNTNEIIKIINDNGLTAEITTKIKLFLEWNFIPNRLKEQDQIGSIKDSKRLFETDIVLRESESLEEIIR